MNSANILLASDLGGSFFGFIVVAAAFYFILKFKGVIPESKSFGTRSTVRESDYFYINELLVLTAHIIKIDGKISKKETTYVNKFLFREYGQRRQKRYVSIISDYLKKGYNLNGAIKSLNAECAMSSKLQLIHFLIKVSIVDGYLADTEINALSEITQKLNLTYYQLNSILAMYNFTSEKEEREKRQYKKKKTVTRQSKLNIALTILELNSNATNDDIKKAYRQLVIIHHPDKVLHLDKMQQKLSKEKFLKISDAYELLKTNRGFK
jgi:DnaJ like chaperone protein